MTYEQLDARREYVRRARASFSDEEANWHKNQATTSEAQPQRSTLALRLVLSLLFFLVFVLADLTDYRLFSYSTADVAAEIQKEDYTNLEKYVMMFFADTLRI